MLLWVLGGRRRRGVRDLEVRVAMGVKSLREQHQRGEKQRQKRRRADVERDNQGDGHVAWPPRFGWGRDEISIGVQLGKVPVQGGGETYVRPQRSLRIRLVPASRDRVRATYRIRQREQEVGNAEIRL
jgi:hypothetical protein